LPPPALQQLSEREVNELSLRAAPEPPKTFPDQPIVEHDIGPAHDTVSSTRP